MLNRLTGIFKSFQEHDVKYLVIGGIASILYGIPRTTLDLDVFIEKSEDNAKRLLDALVSAGIATAELTDPEGVLNHEISIFKDRVRVDVHTDTPGITFEDAWQRKEVMTYQDQEFFVVSREDLISSKKASGRPVDIEDVRILELPEE
jgi:hypothetical protein